MATRTSRGERRNDALSKTRIVDAAIAILDADGEATLTFRVLAERLATGAGAIYWHVPNKSELLEAATDTVIADVLMQATRDGDPKAVIRALALGVFEAIDARPWVGAYLARAPWQLAMVQLYEGIGRQLKAAGVPQQAQFDTASALVSYILGVAGQNASNARLLARTTDRETFLTEVAARWKRYDALAYPFVHQIAQQLIGHDDRAQFLNGVEFILAGMPSAT